MTPRRATVGDDIFKALRMTSAGVVRAGLTWRRACEAGRYFRAGSSTVRAPPVDDVPPAIFGTRAFTTLTQTTNRSSLLSDILSAKSPAASSTLISVGDPTRTAFRLEQAAGGATIYSSTIDNVARLQRGSDTLPVLFPAIGNTVLVRLPVLRPEAMFTAPPVALAAAGKSSLVAAPSGPGISAKQTDAIRMAGLARCKQAAANRKPSSAVARDTPLLQSVIITGSAPIRKTNTGQKLTLSVQIG